MEKSVQILNSHSIHFICSIFLSDFLFLTFFFATYWNVIEKSIFRNLSFLPGLSWTFILVVCHLCYDLTPSFKMQYWFLEEYRAEDNHISRYFITAEFCLNTVIESTFIRIRYRYIVFEHCPFLQPNDIFCFNLSLLFVIQTFSYNYYKEMLKWYQPKIQQNLQLSSKEVVIC